MVSWGTSSEWGKYWVQFPRHGLHSELDVSDIEEYTFCWLSQDLYFKKYYLINAMPSELEVDGSWENKPSKGQNLTTVGRLVVDQD